jgi:hypothetical protein
VVGVLSFLRTMPRVRNVLDLGRHKPRACYGTQGLLGSCWLLLFLLADIDVGGGLVSSTADSRFLHRLLLVVSLHDKLIVGAGCLVEGLRLLRLEEFSGRCWCLVEGRIVVHHWWLAFSCLASS